MHKQLCPIGIIHPVGRQFLYFEKTPIEICNLNESDHQTRIHKKRILKIHSKTTTSDETTKPYITTSLHILFALF